jgi:2-C-methyl-D-erythritol 4-phosphate cytidylyltransferase
MADDGPVGRVAAIVVGAGAGRRLGGADKAFLPLLGRPLLAYSIDAFDGVTEVDAVCLVLSAESVVRGAALARERGWRKVAAIVAGGREREDSVRAGMAALVGYDWLVVHDAARPLVTPDLIRRGLAAARATGAAVAATPVRDTLKRVTEAETAASVAATVPRDGLWAAQTPQVFRASLLAQAFEAAGRHAGAFTDDASLVEALGSSVRVFSGTIDNLKVTLPEDIPIVEALLQARERGIA